MKKIRLHIDFKKQIAKEFGVSMVTVDMSLKYAFDSKKAKGIRKRAKELLIKECKAIVI
jgi:hypothetical protein